MTTDLTDYYEKVGFLRAQGMSEAQAEAMAHELLQSSPVEILELMAAIPREDNNGGTT